MSAWSDYKVTGDKADLEIYRQECEEDEKSYWAELEEAEAEREAEEISRLRNIAENSYQQSRADAIDECIKMTTDEKLCQIFEQLKEQTE